MSASPVPIRPAAAPSVDARLDPRVAAYALCLAVAFGLYLAIHGPGRGVGFWGAALAVLAALAWGAAGRAARVRGQGGGREGEPPLPSAWLDGGCAAAAGLALAVPFGAAALDGGAVAAAGPLWPQILVLLFAARLLSETAAARFAAFWRQPLRPTPRARAGSTAAAFALGACLTLVFYHGLALAGVAAPHDGPRSGASLGGALLGAAAGESAVHRGIVFLSFVILALLWADLGQQRRERAALAALQGASGNRDRTGDPRAWVAHTLSAFGPVRTALIVGEAVTGGAQDATRAAAFDAFHHAARRFVRGLVALLPLLGFLGTVVGLSAAMGGLSLDAVGRGDGAASLGASLGGLALKFETTMLGLVASMGALLALAALDRGEAEHEAACLVLADALRGRDAR